MASLADRRILVTRPRGSASKLAEKLEAEGAETISIPAIELAPPASFCALDAALVTLSSYDWLLLTSANAVEAMMNRARLLRVRPYARRIAAIGPATARAVVESGLARAVDLVPSRFVAEGLVEALLPHAPGARMLLVRAAVAREVLPDQLVQAGAELTVVEAYRTVVPRESVEAVAALFRGPLPPDAIPFTSASAAQNLQALLDAAGVSLPPETMLASIGPVTSLAMREMGWKPAVEASEATLDALVQALAGLFKSRAHSSPRAR
jgi:uroporphyrinogen-III synthase